MPYAPLELQLYVLLQTFPGYTARTLLEEDPEIVESLLAIYAGEMRGRRQAKGRG